MSPSSPTDHPRSDVRLDDLSDRVASGRTLLLAGTCDPVEYDVGLTFLSRYGDAGDVAYVVTSTDSATVVDERYTALSADTDGPELKLVDTVSENQYLSALYDSTPTIFTPAESDLERVVLALSELTQAYESLGGENHLLVRSLAPMVEHADVDQVQNVLRRISGLRTGGGFGLFSVDCTTIDDSTMRRLVECVDGIVRVTRASHETIETEVYSRRSYLDRYL